MVMRIEGHPNDYVAALVDFWPGVILREDSPNKALNATGGEIVSAKRLSFKSANDYDKLSLGLVAHYETHASQRWLRNGDSHQARH